MYIKKIAAVTIFFISFFAIANNLSADNKKYQIQFTVFKQGKSPAVGLIVDLDITSKDNSLTVSYKKKTDEKGVTAFVTVNEGYKYVINIFGKDENKPLASFVRTNLPYSCTQVKISLYPNYAMASWSACK